MPAQAGLQPTPCFEVQYWTRASVGETRRETVLKAKEVPCYGRLIRVTGLPVAPMRATACASGSIATIM